MEVDRDGFEQPPPAKRPRLSLESVPDAHLASYDQEGNEKIEPFVAFFILTSFSFG
jgi:hypothetical protein